MWRLYRDAAASMDARRIRTACSWQYFARCGYAPYFVQHTSPLFPQSTAMSVAVTHSNAPSAAVCTAPSSSVDGVPYGSRSTTSNIFSCCIMSIRTSPDAHTMRFIRVAASSEHFALYSTFRAMDAIARGSKSFATTHPRSSSSRAYRTARNPDAAMPSRTRMGFKGGFCFGGASASSSPSLFSPPPPAVPPSPPPPPPPPSFAAFSASSRSCSSWLLYMSSISSAVRRYGRIALSLGVAHISPFMRRFFGVRFSVSCSVARALWNCRITASDRSRFTTWALL
eukprot:31135-Pelagococcus_subviridis.AAC.26